MKKSRTGSSAGEAVASPPVATVQLPLPLLDVLADTRTAFFGLCLDAGQQVLRTMMEQDREHLCGPKNVPNPDRHAYRGGSVPGEVTLGGRRILVPGLRARSVDGHELGLPSFAYAAARDPLDAWTLEAIAIGVTLAGPVVTAQRCRRTASCCSSSALRSASCAWAYCVLIRSAWRKWMVASASRPCMASATPRP
jgi:hypothetical protein